MHVNSIPTSLPDLKLRRPYASRSWLPSPHRKSKPLMTRKNLALPTPRNCTLISRRGTWVRVRLPRRLRSSRGNHLDRLLGTLTMYEVTRMR